jgi:hypothetical protein
MYSDTSRKTLQLMFSSIYLHGNKHKVRAEMCTIPAYTSYQLRCLSFVIRVYKMHTEWMYRFYTYISRAVNVVIIEK